MKKFLVTLSLIVQTLLCAAQDYLSPIGRLNGIEMQKQLFIKYDESTNNFLYYKDESPGTLLQLTQNDLINIKGTDNGKYTLAIEFYNPLRVKFKFDETRVADPAIEAINTFISKFPTEFVQFNMEQAERKVEIETGESGKNNIYESLNERYFDYAPNSQEPKKLNVNDYFSSYIISQWIYEFHSALEGKIAPNDSARAISLFKEMRQIEDAEDYLFGRISIESKSETLNDWILNFQKKIYGVTLASEFRDQLTEARKIYEKLLKAKQDAENALSNFFNLITYNYEEEITPFFKNRAAESLKFINAGENFKKYSRASVALINVLVDQRKQNNDEALRKFNEFLDALQKFYNEFHPQATNSGATRIVKILQTSQIRHDEGIIKNIFVSATMIDEKGKENTDVAKSLVFNISRWNSMYPIVSAGSLFTNFSFPSYTIDSLNSILDVSRKKIRATPAVYLNFYTNYFKNDYLYFFLQFGVAPLNDNGGILFPIGGGFSIGGSGALANRVTFSGGFLPALIKELNKLNVGDKVRDDATLKDDLSYKLYSAGYFSININIFK